MGQGLGSCSESRITSVVGRLVAPTFVQRIIRLVVHGKRQSGVLCCRTVVSNTGLPLSDTVFHGTANHYLSHLVPQSIKTYTQVRVSLAHRPDGVRKAFPLGAGKEDWMSPKVQ
jgi:hypothetical protein